MIINFQEDIQKFLRLKKRLPSFSNSQFVGNLRMRTKAPVAKDTYKGGCSCTKTAGIHASRLWVDTQCRVYLKASLGCFLKTWELTCRCFERQELKYIRIRIRNLFFFPLAVGLDGEMFKIVQVKLGRPLLEFTTKLWNRSRTC